MNEKTQTTVETNHRNRSVTINGETRAAYPSPLGLRSRLSHANVRALGLEARHGENYELIDGRVVRTFATSERRIIESLPALRDCDDPTKTTLIAPLPEPEKPASVPRPPRGLSRRYGPLIRAARAIAPVLPEGHELRRALEQLDSY